jgi:hypothetical protein
MNVIETAGVVLKKTQVKVELQKGTSRQSSQLYTSRSACASTARFLFLFFSLRISLVISCHVDNAVCARLTRQLCCSVAG